MPVISDREERVERVEIFLPENSRSFVPGIERRAVIWCWIAVFIFGLFQAMAFRFSMNPDGISYSDLADAYNRADWQSAISPYWSPLYPFLLSISFRLFHPSPAFEAVAIHLLNFLLYLGCFASLQLFILEIANRRSLSPGNGSVRFSRTALTIFGTIAFLATTEYYLPLSLVTPDLCVVALALVAGAMILRIDRLGISNKRLATLGLILGAGYLAKAAFFPVAFVFMAAALGRKADYRRIVTRAAITLAAFLAIAGPNVLAVSRIKHSLSFADTGNLNYLWFVNGMSSIHFERPGNVQGTPIHPSRKVFENPDVYEFRSPVQGTYPVWFNPSYWNEGTRPRFDFAQQLNAIQSTSHAYELMFSKASWFFFVWLLLAILQHQCGLSLRTNFVENWRIFVPSLAALALYWPVFVEGRYVAGFILIIWVAMYASIRLPDNRISGRVFFASLTVLAIATVINLYPKFHSYAEISFQPMPNGQWEVAKALHRDFKLQENDSVGCMGNCFFCYWARLGKLRIVTEMPNRQALVFSTSKPATQLAALRTMAATGAKVVVTTVQLGNGWQRIEGTDYFVYDLRSLAGIAGSR